jgi:hypothetical protein
VEDFLFFFRLIDFSPAGCLRHVLDVEDDDVGVSEITDQEWIEGSCLVIHRLLKWDFSGDDTGSEDQGKSEENCRVESRIVVTFYQGKFIYKERVGNTRKCTKCRSCSYVYSVEAWFSKTSCCLFEWKCVDYYIKELSIVLTLQYAGSREVLLIHFKVILVLIKNSSLLGIYKL